MNKEVPSIGRILIMAFFTLSCFGLLLFLWLAFGGSVPLKPEGYRFRTAFPEATTLAEEADVRIAGVNVGKVKKKELEQGAARTVVEMELDDEYAPIPMDSRAILRMKTLLGETFVELSPGSQFAAKLPENGQLAQGQVEDTVELDEIQRVFDNPTKRAIATWVRELARVVKRDRSEDVNDALGNLPGFAGDGADVLKVLDVQEKALTDWIRNTGVVFNALNRREGELSDLIVNSSRVFSATQARDDELAETIRVFPSFLREFRVSQRRLAEFARDTRPLVNDLKPVADQLGPTVRDLSGTGPDLEATLKSLDPLIQESRKTLPEAVRLLRGVEPLLEAAHTFLPEFNPALSYLNFQKQQLSDFIVVPATATAATLPGRGAGPRHYLPQLAFINNRSFEVNGVRESNERANSYFAPNALTRQRPLGVPESFDCRPSGGEKQNPSEGLPPCFVQPPMLFDGNKYPRLPRGKTPLTPSPFLGNEGTQPANP
jgi:virulence factor Mce-like protein